MISGVSVITKGAWSSVGLATFFSTFYLFAAGSSFFALVDLPVDFVDFTDVLPFALFFSVDFVDLVSFLGFDSLPVDLVALVAGFLSLLFDDELLAFFGAVSFLGEASFLGLGSLLGFTGSTGFLFLLYSCYSRWYLSLSFWLSASYGTLASSFNVPHITLIAYYLKKRH